jgi:sugar lactone lactonase YvrE
MKKIIQICATILFLIIVYLSVKPIPVDPVSWVSTPFLGYEGAFGVNERLANLKMIPLSGEEAPEHIMIAKDGLLYTTVVSGNILRMTLDGKNQEIFVNTGGRVLGFDFDAEGNLIAADSLKGLLSISPDRKISLLTDKIGDSPIRYADGVVIAKSGKIYFTDASTRFPPSEWGGTFESSILDILEQSCSGRVLVYDTITRTTTLLAKGFSFANGIALSQDEKSLFVNETGKYRIWKLSVDSQDLDISLPSPNAVLLLENLPGYPDNLMRGLDGKIWAGLAKPRNSLVDKIADKPFLRKVTLRLPRFLWPIPKAYGHVFAFTEDGKVTEDLQDPSGAYPETTGVTETPTRLYIQSLHSKTIGYLEK